MSLLYNNIQSISVTLASTSPRRKEILTKMGIKFQTMNPNVEENISKHFVPDEYVEKTARLKLDASIVQLSPKLAQLHKWIVISADTIVTCDGKIFEKPKSPAHHKDSLAFITDSHKPVEVKTAVFVTFGNFHNIIGTRNYVETTALIVDDKVDDAFLDWYVSTGEGSGAAGGFQIQGLGGLLFSSIQGDYCNVVGLPFTSCWRLLEKAVEELEKSGKPE